MRWRSGPRPPRKLATPRERLGVSPRADYDESAYYHCVGCGTQFIDHLASPHGLSRLQVEGGGPTYRYDDAARTWRPSG
ncbi:MAG: hypothetical protein JXA89_05175 [Anaerolineae bacterium]|nr:hypothetical protein [Anaerolineae bacterium]